eukprot:6468214-Amphidinium_carterae.1
MPPMQKRVVEGGLRELLYEALTAKSLTYLQPEETDMPVIDACLGPVMDGRLICFQCTISRYHSFDKMAVTSALEGLSLRQGEVPRIEVWWIRPRVLFRGHPRSPIDSVEQRLDMCEVGLRNPYNTRSARQHQKLQLDRKRTEKDVRLRSHTPPHHWLRHLLALGCCNMQFGHAMQFAQFECFDVPLRLVSLAEPDKPLTHESLQKRLDTERAMHPDATEDDLKKQALEYFDRTDLRQALTHSLPRKTKLGNDA